MTKISHRVQRIFASGKSAIVKTDFPTPLNQYIPNYEVIRNLSTSSFHSDKGCAKYPLSMKSYFLLVITLTSS